MIAEIIIQSKVKNLNKTFDYEIPKEMEEKIKIGSRVLVPFGNMKSLSDGFVINIKESSNYKPKAIAKVENTDLLDERKIELAKWMAHNYFCNISDCLKLMLPPGTTTKVLKNRVKEKNVDFVFLKKEIEEIEADIQNSKIKSDKQIRILKFLIDNDEISIADLMNFTDTTRAVINALVKKEYIEIIKKSLRRDPFENKNIERTKKLILTKEQKEALEVISNSIDDMLFSEFLIYGVTGARKNRSIYAINR